MSTDTCPTRIVVPVLGRKTWRVPDFMNRLAEQRWKGTACFWDIDKTILGSSDAHTPNILSGRMLFELARSLQMGQRHAFVTGADFVLQEKRVIVPLREYLQRLGRLDAMANVVLSANRGGSLGLYSPIDGQLDQAAFDAHLAKYGIDKNDWTTLKAIYEKVIDAYWQNFLANESTYRAKYPNFNFQRPRIEQRGGAQNGLKPFPGTKALDEIIIQIQRSLPKELLNRYDLVPGGGTTVDVNRKGVNKPHAIELIAKGTFNLPWPQGQVSMADIESGRVIPVFGGGDEFRVIARPDGKPSVGGDFPMLEVPHLVALAVNPDQKTVNSVLSLGPGRQTRRIFALGSGPAATRVFFNYANGGKVAATLEMPVEVNTELSIPDPVINFTRTAGQTGMIVLSGSILTGFRHGKDADVIFDPAIVEVVELLKQGIPVVVSTGGDYEERVKPIMAVLKEVVEKSHLAKAVLQRILFYSNGGGFKSAFNQLDGSALFDHTYNSRCQIPEADFLKLAEILGQLANAYMTDPSIMAEHGNEFPEAPPIVDQRYEHSQISLLPLIEAKRCALLTQLRKLLPEAQLIGQYEPQLGGHSIDITKQGVDKAMVLEDAAAHFGRQQILYLGEELAFVFDEDGGTILTKIDMRIFASSVNNTPGNLLAIALNPNQDSIPDHPAIFPGGSGLLAARMWLRTLNQMIRAANSA